MAQLGEGLDDCLSVGEPGRPLRLSLHRGKRPRLADSRRVQGELRRSGPRWPASAQRPSGERHAGPVAEPDRGGAVRAAEMNGPLRPAAVARLVKENELPVGREVARGRVVEERQIPRVRVAAGRSDDFKTVLVVEQERPAVAGDVLEGQRSYAVVEESETSGSVDGVE